MILVDRNIKKLVSENKLIVQGYKESSVRGIAYELSVDCVYNADKENSVSLDLKPGDVAYIKTEEKLSVPDNIAVRIIERNSVMRLGLKVDGPEYIPGHTTFCFLRVQNISDSVITVSKGFKIAQAIFEELKEVPEQTYEKQPDASFHDEKEFIGVGRYQPEYNKFLKKLDDAKEDLEAVKDKIYGNVLTIMGIFVSIFTLVSVNIQAFVKESISKSLVASVNLSLLSCIAVLLGFVLLIVNKGKKKWFNIAYFIFMLCLIIATLIIALF